jgi:hypothetical protein
MHRMKQYALFQFKIGLCKIESEPWVPPADRPYQYSTKPLNYHDIDMELELEQYRLRKEMEEIKIESKPCVPPELEQYCWPKEMEETKIESKPSVPPGFEQYFLHKKMEETMKANEEETMKAKEEEEQFGGYEDW